MRGLLVKDFSVLREQKKFFLVILVMTIFLSLRSSDYFAITYLTFLGGFLVISSISFDDNANCISFLMTLPVSRRLYVQEKYVFGFMTAFIGWFSGVVITSAVSLAQGNVPQWNELIFNVSWMFLFAMFISLILPPTLKYGVEKGRMALFIIMMAVVGGIYLIVKVLKSINIDVDAVIEGLSGLESLALVAALGVCSILFAVVSCGISIRIMQKKEF